MNEGSMAGSPNRFERQRQWTVAAVIGLGFFVTYTEAFRKAVFPYSPLEVLITFLVGGTYLILSLKEDQLLDRHLSPAVTAAYFIVQFGLLIVLILIFQEINGIWLLPVPLIGTAVGRLSTRGQLAVTAAALILIAGPVGLRHGWGDAVFVSASVLPAFIFVALFVRLLVQANDARAEAERLAVKLEEANNRLTAYATQAEEMAIKDERNRLAREIHDSLGHYLTVINIQLEAALVTLESDPAHTSTAIAQAQTLAQEGLASVRQSVAAFRTTPAEVQPLTETISSLLEEVKLAGLVAEFETRGQHRNLPPNSKLALYRIAQEALTNVRKHARASRVDVLLDYRDPEQIKLSVQDNGIGGNSDPTHGFGLLGIQERVQLLDGDLQIETAAGQGFKLTVLIPG
jgi:signal transduction histidine kinase